MRSSLIQGLSKKYTFRNSLVPRLGGKSGGGRVRREEASPSQPAAADFNAWQCLTTRDSHVSPSASCHRTSSKSSAADAGLSSRYVLGPRTSKAIANN